MMRRLSGVLAVLVVATPLGAQTINGESNYEDGLTHMPPAQMDGLLKGAAKSQDTRSNPQAADKQPETGK